MALTDSLQLSESKDRNGNVCYRKSPNRNLTQCTQNFKESRTENSVYLSENPLRLCENSAFHLGNSLSYCENSPTHCEKSLLCLQKSETKLDNLEMKNLAFRDIVQEQNNNNILDQCEQICPGQMVHFFTSNLDSDKFKHNDWITRNAQDQCFVNDSLLISDNDRRVPCCDLNDFKNVTLRISDFDSYNMEKKTKTSSRRDSRDEEDSDAKRPRTELSSSKQCTQASSTDTHAVLAATSFVSESHASNLTSIEAQDHSCESKEAAVRPMPSDKESASKEPMSRSSDVIRVTKSMKSCSIETKQASAESQSSSSRPVSIVAPIDSSVTVSTRSRSIQSDLILPPVSWDLHIDSLLDEECSLYTSRLTSVVHEIQPVSERETTNPVSVLLNQGDDKHFIPINDTSDSEDEEP
ncbi:hypothetical protein LOTGIDRAFT_170341 [Lottia gigantea]|uniref:Uncharacterized protein n=1 Tax=Lottia gigantea TaxID=225164 RepID=V3ZMK4_LOTGI|nr:hypothetical protein LOTGIDRAFT_170341 [Lottia gigantea]ESO82066.1 hypothetical protein LOTGIDRAFT_170341 [Lottia gigantea]